MPIPDPIANLPQALDGADDTTQFTALTAALTAIPDLQQQLAGLRAEVMQRLKVGRTWDEVGELVGLHPVRASQIARGVSGGTKKRTTPST